MNLTNNIIISILIIVLAIVIATFEGAAGGVMLSLGLILYLGTGERKILSINISFTVLCSACLLLLVISYFFGENILCNYLIMLTVGSGIFTAFKMLIGFGKSEETI